MNYGRIVATARDRASVLKTMIMQIIETAPAEELEPAIEEYLRDEIADIERQVASDRQSHDE